MPLAALETQLRQAQHGNEIPCTYLDEDPFLSSKVEPNGWWNTEDEIHLLEIVSNNPFMPWSYVCSKFCDERRNQRTIWALKGKYKTLRHNGETVDSLKQKAVAHAASEQSVRQTVLDLKPKEDDPVRKTKKWSQEEDNLIMELRGKHMMWEDISKCFPGRTTIACQHRFKNYLSPKARRSE